MRVRARPECDKTLALRVPGTTASDQAAAVWHWLRFGEHSPWAAEMISPALALRLGTDPEACLLLRLGGNAAFVRAARDAVGAL